jgi:hypothetical protein
MTDFVLPYQRSWSGNPDVDEALARLHSLDELPVTSHAEVYEDIHETLRSALDDAGVGPGPRPATS